jgi:mono/diheme cytochrome c family protein
MGVHPKVGRMSILLLLVAAVALIGVAVARARGNAGTSVKVTVTDRKIVLSRKTAPVGKVTFSIRNHGKRVHNFRVGGKTSKPVQPGKGATLVVVFKSAKSYAFLSTLPHGATKGLNGVLKVLKAGPAVPGNPKAGAAVFASAGCSGCHTLEAAGAKGTVGPNLDQKKPSYATVKATVTNGKGSMPAFKSTLTVTQIQNVAAYVYASTHGS